MLPLPKGAAWQTLFLISALFLIKEATSEGRVVCYYTNWSVYRPGTAKFNPQNINPYLCTHLIYAFGGFTKDNTLKPFDKYQDIEQGGYTKFTGLKSYNKNLKTLLAIGGWNEGSSRFSPLVASPERRQQFIRNVLKFLRQNHFDGLDLDWEYPAHRDGGKPRDKENYAQFVQELRSEFDRESSKTGRPRLLLTMAVPAGVQYIEKGYDIPKLNKYLDWFNLLSYDYHSAYEPSVNHHSPLYSLEEASEYNYEGDLNIDYTIKFYLEAGADRDKLVLGIPTYGRSYTLINDEDTEIGAPADGPGDQGDATREKGYLAYYEICQNLKEDPDWTVVQPNPKAMGPYAFKGNQWVGYDDVGIVQRKAEFVAENHLGGIMFWSIDNDDFRGSCTGKPYPLIEAAKDAMLDRLGVGDNEVSRPSKPKKPQRGRSRLNSSSDRNRVGSDSRKDEVVITKKATSGRRTSNRRKTTATTTTTTTTTTTPTSLYIGGRSTTPAPPTTPDPGSDFKCEEEGFFAHPRDCKKYFWCLDSGPSNLGIVAHQFTCPSGLYFNTAADSCDFTRNVLCKTSKKTTTAKPAVTTPSTTTTTTTTTTRPRITAATSRNSFLRRVTSTTTTEAPYDEEEEEYIDEEEIDEDSNRTIDAEEDPRVIKELIELIKKVGGLEELEKQLQLQEDGSMALKNSKTQTVSTTPSSISKSLYAKVLSRPNNLKNFQSRFSAAALSKATEAPTAVQDEVEEEETQSDRSAGKKYSSVVRNSRPGPQNAGIDKLAEFEGFLREKPKYVTINRTRPTLPITTSDDEEDVEEHEKVEVVDSEEIEEEEPAPVEERRRIATTRITTSSPSYVNIRRTRPTTAAPEQEDRDDERVSEVVEEEVAHVTSRTSYQFLSRRRGTTTTFAPEVEETVTPTATQSRYKTIERTRRVSTIAPENHDISEDIVRNRGSATYFTVEDTDSKQDTVASITTTTQDKSITTQPSRVYAKISRRTTTTAEPTFEPLQSTEIPVEYSTEPTTVGTTQSSSTATTTTTPTTTILTTTTTPVPTTVPTLSSHETTLGPESETVPTILDTVSRQTDIPSDSLLSTTQTLGLSQEPTPYTLTDTTKLKDETNIATIVDDDEQVKKTSIGGVENDVNSSSNKPNTQLTSSAISKDSSLNVYKESSTLREVDSSHSHQLKETTSSDTLTETKETTDDGKLVVEIVSTQRTPAVRTRRPLFRGTTTTTTPTPETTTEFLGTVSSPRPFGFPRRRLRPSSKFSPSTTTAPESSASVTTSTNIDNNVQDIETNTSTKKFRPQNRLNGSRRPAFTVRRRLTTPASSSGVNADEVETTLIPSTLGDRESSGAVVPSGGGGNIGGFSKYVRRSRPTFAALTSKNAADLKTQQSLGEITGDNPSSSSSPSGNTPRKVVRRKFNGRPLPNRRTTSSPEELELTTITEPPRTTNPLFKRRFSTSSTTPLPDRFDNDQLVIATTTPLPATTPAADAELEEEVTEDDMDQQAGSSVHDTKFLNNRYSKIGEQQREANRIKAEIDAAIKNITAIPEVEESTQPITRRIGLGATRRPSARRPQKTTTTTTAAPSSSPPLRRRKPSKPEVFEKINPGRPGRTYRPIVDYDYYDDEDVPLVSKTSSQVKVILHGRGIIECLDQGNFPHPLSCKKFISCAKMEIGGVVGWEYTCPKGLSYDPVGGICNWAAGLGCKE